MRELYFDCFAGISGDMTIAALIDAGLDFEMLKRELGKIELQGYSLSCEKTKKCGIAGTSFRVDVTRPQPERTLNEILDLINSSGLDDDVKHDACGIFTLLGDAESAVHGVKKEDLHFHEIGAVDSIIDICGISIAMAAMGFPEVHSSAINTGSGYTNSSHGMLPVPAPATAKLLEGMEVYSTGVRAELTTPTGAAILKYYSRSFGPLRPVKILSSGYGAGLMDLEIPNLLRILTVEKTKPVCHENCVTELETNMDDMNPEFFTSLYERLLGSGALDVAVTPAVMKKNRPGHILKVLVYPRDEHRIIRIIFHETTTSGIRISHVSRVMLERRIADVQTEFGIVRVKIHEYEGEVTSVSPEFEDCRIRAEENNVSVKVVYNAAIAGGYSNF